MAQIVRIGEGWVRDNCKVGDIVAIHDDNVELSGAGYENAEITKIPGVSAEEVRAKLNALTPKRAMAFKASTTAWSFTPPEEKEVWQDADGKWKFLSDPPKYVMNLLPDKTQETQLADTKTSTSTRLAVLESAMQDNISTNEENSTEVSDLNKTGDISA